jgi:hypothetical protein
MTRIRVRTHPALSLSAWLGLCLLAFSGLGLTQVQADGAEASPSSAQLPVAVAAGRYCYNWDFANNTPQDANDLHLVLGGISHVGSWYTGARNPFGMPDASSGYDPGLGAYRANFSGAVVLPGETVHIGFCADQPALEAKEATWTVDGAAVAPAPMAAHVRFTPVNPSQVRVEVINPQSFAMTLWSFNVLDGADGLPLDDLNGQVASQLAAIGEPLLYPEVLPPGGSKFFDVLTVGGAQATVGENAEQLGAIDPDHALVVEAVLTPEDDDGNLLHVLAQMLPPGKQFLPLVRRQ